MGGLDKLDVLYIYRSFLRRREWTITMRFQGSDLVLMNAWLEYKQHAKMMDNVVFNGSVAEHSILLRNL